MPRAQGLSAPFTAACLSLLILPAPVSAADFVLPEGAEVVALGRGPGEVLILTREPSGAETLRVFDAASGAETSATPVRRE